MCRQVGLLSYIYAPACLSQNSACKTFKLPIALTNMASYIGKIERGQNSGNYARK
jgi:hypothetical protein